MLLFAIDNVGYPLGTTGCGARPIKTPFCSLAADNSRTFYAASYLVKSSFSNKLPLKYATSSCVCLRQRAGSPLDITD